MVRIEHEEIQKRQIDAIMAPIVGAILGIIRSLISAAQ